MSDWFTKVTNNWSSSSQTAWATWLTNIWHSILFYALWDSTIVKWDDQLMDWDGGLLDRGWYNGNNNEWHTGN